MTPESVAATLDDTAVAPRVSSTLHIPTLSRPRPARPAVARHQIGRTSAWLAKVDTVHRGQRSLVAPAVDAAVAFGAAVGLGVPMIVAAILASVTALSLYVGGWYIDRSCVETQGVFWAVRPLAFPIGLTTLASVTVAHAAGWNVGDMLLFGGVAMGGLLALRILTWGCLATARRRGNSLRRTLIVGDSKHARMLSKKLIDYPEAGLLPIAMLPAGNGHGYLKLLPPFPSAAQLSATIAEGDVEHVVLAPDGSDEAILECVKGFEGLDVGFSLLPPLSELFLHPGLVAQVGGLPLIPLNTIARTRTTLPGKRVIDLLLTSLILLIAAPLFAATALAIKLFDNGPILYRQRRVGRDGKPFYMLKFRSMVVDAERLVIDLRDQNVTNGLLFKVVDDPRITRVGRLIRRISIDELPQLLNVMRGEMSLVGPRPLPVEPEDFDAVDNKRHSVLPGITGYWQIAGGTGLSYEEMIKLDLAYIQNWSLWLDCRLLLRTIPAVVHRRSAAF
jgi:exopolysaccharide biosynthesis polyprenyl glycosylphosphotransferase